MAFVKAKLHVLFIFSQLWFVFIFFHLDSSVLFNKVKQRCFYRDAHRTWVSFIKSVLKYHCRFSESTVTVKSDIKPLKYPSNQAQFAQQCCIYEWMSFYPLVFFAYLEFKCMQRSKPLLMRQRWCNMQKPLDQSQPFLPRLFCSLKFMVMSFSKPPPGGRSAQQCLSSHSFISHSVFLIFSPQHFVSTQAWLPCILICSTLASLLQMLVWVL